MIGSSKIFNSSDRSMSDWNDYYHAINRKGIYHCPAYIKSLERHYESPAELFVYEADANNFIYYPYFRRDLNKLPFSHLFEKKFGPYFDIESSWYYGGPLIQTERSTYLDELVESFITAFSTFCKDTGVVSEFIRFDPNLGNHDFFKDLLPLARNRKTVYIDLKQSETQIWKNFKGRARTAIRKAKKLGVSVHVASQNDKELRKFFEIYTNEMGRKNAPRHYHFNYDFIKYLYENINEQIKLIYAEVNGVFISAGLFIYDPEDTVHYYLMATLREYQKYQANNLIIHEAMLFFKKKGVCIFDLQGGREGVYNFKKSFSKNRARFYTAGIVHNPTAYEDLIRCKEKYMGADTSDFFPRYRMKETN